MRQYRSCRFVFSCVNLNKHLILWLRGLKSVSTTLHGTVTRSTQTCCFWIDTETRELIMRIGLASRDRWICLFIFTHTRVHLQVWHRNTRDKWTKESGKVHQESLVTDPCGFKEMIDYAATAHKHLQANGNSCHGIFDGISIGRTHLENPKADNIQYINSWRTSARIEYTSFNMGRSSLSCRIIPRRGIIHLYHDGQVRHHGTEYLQLIH